MCGMRWAFLAAILASGPVVAQGPSKGDPPPKGKAGQKSLADEINALRQEKQKREQEAVQKFRATQDQAEKQKIRTEYMKYAAELDRKVLDLAKKKPQDPAAFNVFVQNHSKEALDLLVKYHLDNPRLGLTCLQLCEDGSPQIVAFIRTVRERSKSDDIRGMATAALATALKSQANEAEDESVIEKLNTEAEKLYAMAESKYGGIKAGRTTVGEYAKGNLFELRHLVVGKPAPDLTGPDLDGKSMKLSDYKGKVIFLDFWAHW